METWNIKSFPVNFSTNPSEPVGLISNGCSRVGEMKMINHEIWGIAFLQRKPCVFPSQFQKIYSIYVVHLCSQNSVTLKTLGNSGPSTQSTSMLIYLICFNNDKKEAIINRGLVNFLNHPSCSDFSSFFTLFIPKNVPPSVVQEGTAAMLQHFAIPWMP